MDRQIRRLTSAIAAGLVLALTACGGTAVSPSSYRGAPDSANLTLSVEAATGDSIAEAKVDREDDQTVVVMVRVDEPRDRKPGESVILEAEILLDKPLGNRQVIDQDGSAVPRS